MGTKGQDKAMFSPYSQATKFAITLCLKSNLHTLIFKDFIPKIC